MSTSKNKQRLAKERKAAAAIAARQAAERRRRLRIGGAIAVVLVVIVVTVAVVLLSKDDGSSNDSAAVDSTSTTLPPFTYGTGECAPVAGKPDPAQLTFPGTDGFKQCVDPASVYTATFTTTAGTIVVQLDAATQPGTVNNFVQLVGFGYYDGSQLFRTDPSIGIVQGGAPHTNSPSDPGPGFTITDEGSGFTYRPGQLVMARVGGQPDSAGSQFFFTVTDASSSLDKDGTYVVFGTVTSGLDILESILASNVAGTSGLGGSPSPPVTITSVVVGEGRLVTGSSSTVDPSASTPVPSSTPAPSTTAPSSTVDPSVSTPQSTVSTSIPA